MGLFALQENLKRPGMTPEINEAGRRASRFKAAEQRIRRIVDAAPPLTEEQRQQLALLLYPADK